MKIWKLTPINLDFAGWCCSNYKGVAIVRAKNEEEARDIAKWKFWSLAEKISSAQETPSSPWDNPAVVECTELLNSNYPKDGPAELLEPEIEDSDI